MQRAKQQILRPASYRLIAGIYDPDEVLVIVVDDSAILEATAIERLSQEFKDTSGHTASFEVWPIDQEVILKPGIVYVTITSTTPGPLDLRHDQLVQVLRA